MSFQLVQSLVLDGAFAPSTRFAMVSHKLCCCQRWNLARLSHTLLLISLMACCSSLNASFLVTFQAVFSAEATTWSTLSTNTVVAGSVVYEYKVNPVQPLLTNKLRFWMGRVTLTRLTMLLHSYPTALQCIFSQNDLVCISAKIWFFHLFFVGRDWESVWLPRRKPDKMPCLLYTSPSPRD